METKTKPPELTAAPPTTMKAALLPSPLEPQSTAKPTRPQEKDTVRKRPEGLRRPRQPVLRFSPPAWAKLLHFRDHGETEIGGFGISSAGDLLRIEEFETVRQEVTVASVAFADEAVADFFDQQVGLGRKPEQFCRVWLHTHPGESPEPSGTDEATFERVFGRCQWAVMFILGRTGQTYACLRFSVGPGGRLLIPVEVDYRGSFTGSDVAAWTAAYQAHIHPTPWCSGVSHPGGDSEFLDGGLLGRQSLGGRDWLERFERLHPEERAALVDELSARPDLWAGLDEEEPVCPF